MASFQQVELTILHKFLLIVRLAVRRMHNLSVWPAITYASTIVVSRERYETGIIGLLDDNGDIFSSRQQYSTGSVH